jgi:hypothetical protein
VERHPFSISGPIRKRPKLTSFHPTPPGSSSLLQVSIGSEEVHRLARSKRRQRCAQHNARMPRGEQPCDSQSNRDLQTCHAQFLGQ